MGSSSRAASGPGVIRIQALRYRSLRYVSQELGPFQVLVGPNASGKSNFLDVVALAISDTDLVDTDLVTAIGGDWRLGMRWRSMFRTPRGSSSRRCGSGQVGATSDRLTQCNVRCSPCQRTRPRASFVHRAPSPLQGGKRWFRGARRPSR